jgi:cyanophycinase-like exopeptidase
MAGPIALHGGGEFLAGDEPFLLACLQAALPAARARAAAPVPARSGEASGDDPGADPGAVRALVVPAAAADQRPELAAAHGVEALRRVAAVAGIAVRVEAAMVVDAASASSPALANRLAGADLVHLPGGDPGRLLEVLAATTPAWRAILAAHARGAVVAGASAGAMALAGWCWTPRGWRTGLGLVPGLVVVPHAERVARDGWTSTFAATIPPEAEPVGRLGLDERTGVLRTTGRNGGSAWLVVGIGRAHWSPDGATAPRSVPAGEPLHPSA